MVTLFSTEQKIAGQRRQDDNRMLLPGVSGKDLDLRSSSVSGTENNMVFTVALSPKDEGSIALD